MNRLVTRNTFIIETSWANGGRNCRVPMIDKAWIEEWAGKYDYNKVDVDKEKRILEAIEKVGPSPSCFTKAILMMIVDWKSPRSKGYASKNDEQFVRDVTQVSFSTRNEELKIGALTLMKGVNYRIASTILYFHSPNRYPIMDWRAWKSLMVLGEMPGEIGDTYESWQKYAGVCREIAKRNRVSLRTLDKALWMYKGGAK